MKLLALLSLAIFLIAAAAIAPVRADDDVAFSYLHIRNLLPTPPASASDLSIDENSSPQSSKYYELSGRVVGQITSNQSPIVLVQTGDATVEVSAPQSFLDRADWMDTGSVVRMLVKSGQSPINDGSEPILQLIAAAPEAGVSFLEKKFADDEARSQAAQQAKVQARIRSRSITSETSRSATMSTRFVLSSVPVTGLSDRAAAIYPAYRDTISRLNPNLSENDVETITKSILYYADEYQLDPRLIVAMVVAESGFDPDCVSKTGAVGLGQLMPGTASELGVTDAFDPQQNIAAAVHLLSDHVQRYGGASPCGVVPLNTLLLTMAAYNAGPGAVKKYGGVPPYRETQNYVRRVNELYRQLCGS